jgi:hypothetical protein
MNRKSVTILAIGSALVLGAATMTLSARNRLPIRGTFTGKLLQTPISQDPPAWSIRAAGKLRLAGIGVGTAEISYDRVDLAPGGNNLLAGAEPGRGVFTLSNGSQGFGTVRWLTVPTEDPNVLAIVGTLSVTHGTGVLANFRGHATAIGRGNVTTGEVAFSVEGFLERVPPPGP